MQPVESVVDLLAERWDGPRWRWWTVAGGVLLSFLLATVAVVVAALMDQRVVPLLMLFLIVVILAGSIVGSGILDSMTSRMSRGGLARETTELVEEALTDKDRRRQERQLRQVQDRRTIRSALFIVGPGILFIYLMTIV